MKTRTRTRTWRDRDLKDRGINRFNNYPRVKRKDKLKEKGGLNTGKDEKRDKIKKYSVETDLFAPRSRAKEKVSVALDAYLKPHSAMLWYFKNDFQNLRRKKKNKRNREAYSTAIILDSCRYTYFFFIRTKFIRTLGFKSSKI